ncbi:2-phosphosulfolactate phosphatase [Paenibacillus silviterrae]|uniref:2-phosphosulfolactate phosphatase n=1 Tax=Paenibacillus silviterrae TaxID=3242194 RepID=UPI0025427B64|nr:2-phosphosulfolactate phosphatase [Paenibacillus chinjuensis]
MYIHVIPSVNEAQAEDVQQKVVIVIDVLRATSTMLTALANGAKEIYPVETVQQAKQLYQPGFLLGGERHCKRIPGFDLGNSPLEYQDNHVAGKTLVITTTNGTRAIEKSAKASHIFIGSLLNARACAMKAAELGKDIAIVCSGTQDVFSLEDGLCAGLIVQELIELAGDGVQVNDFGLSMLHAYRQVQDNVLAALQQCSNGKRLMQIGFPEDVAYCSQVNTMPLVAMVQQGKLQLV